jgi:hypothetical protein
VQIDGVVLAACLREERGTHAQNTRAPVSPKPADGLPQDAGSAGEDLAARDDAHRGTCQLFTRDG